MPRIFDNISEHLLRSLQDTLSVSNRADFCVGYFNLRGWKHLDSYISDWQGGEGHCCRLIVGMQRSPEDELREAFRLSETNSELSFQAAVRLKIKLAEQFREQLVIGVPTNQDEVALRNLADKIRGERLIIKVYLRHPLHAKLYLLYRNDINNPVTGYVGSSNLTLAGLAHQGELNVDVLDHDAANKLSQWFEDRWQDELCFDISDELLAILENSWAGKRLIPPYHIYLKMAYHLSQEAREGLTDYRVPTDFGDRLFDYQTAAVKLAAHHLNRRGGVIIGDVVGLGKTLMATALARIFEDDFGLETLIICPKNLVPMWEDYRDQYRLRAKVIPISKVNNELSNLRRFRLIIIDESHNLRNREGKRYRAIQEYIQENESKVILLTATPYNKTYLDLSSQLRLFVSEDTNLGIRPENYIREIGETEFARRHQCLPQSILAFEKSTVTDDWRELMRLYLVRRTRSFIQENYAHYDPARNRRYLVFSDGTKSYFPIRQPRTTTYVSDSQDSLDQYAHLYSDDVLQVINHLNLPRYGLANYISKKTKQTHTSQEQRIIDDLNRADKTLMGFCRTNMFKRLESSGPAFLLSLERHILRNYVFLYAIDNDKPIPIGTQGAELLDSAQSDDDRDYVTSLFDNDGEVPPVSQSKDFFGLTSEHNFYSRAAEVYRIYEGRFSRRFSWLRSTLFDKKLKKHLEEDALALLGILQRTGFWNPEHDQKLNQLIELLGTKHLHDKVLVFTQFADTAFYLEREIKRAGFSQVASVTGDSENPTSYVWRFSPESNGKTSGPNGITPETELRVLITTDVLSEGQNLQDCHIVINFDLPWAIIRLIQRAGRVDRIGQKSDEILCYTFLPADGVEKIIRLRSRVEERLKENAELVGTDEQFFENEGSQILVDLYNEKSGILDSDVDGEVDLSSYAFQIWKQAIEKDRSLQRIIPALPSVVYSAKAHTPELNAPTGALVYLRTAEGNNALAWVNEQGQVVSQSQYAILRAAACTAETYGLQRSPNHHELVLLGARHIVQDERLTGGQLGKPSGARFRTYERLKRYYDELNKGLFTFEADPIKKVLDSIYRSPLRQGAIDALNRQLRSGISDSDLANMAISLLEDERLTVLQDENNNNKEPTLICSMGLQEGGLS